MRDNKIISILCICTVMLTGPRSAYAYLDPGTGSMLIQMLIGGIVAAMFTIKMYWYNLKSFIRRKLGKENTQISEDLNNNTANKQDDSV